jgi:MFS family permease
MDVQLGLTRSQHSKSYGRRYLISMGARIRYSFLCLYLPPSRGHVAAVKLSFSCRQNESSPHLEDDFADAASIMFRWLQGVGGCGILALGQLVFIELVPPNKYPKYIGIVSVAMTAPLVCGPLVGGSITLSGDWRWVFLIKYDQTFTFT